MLNPGRYKKIDYSGLLGSFVASWLLHCALFVIAATTTIFYPPTADREYISVDLLFASPGSKKAALPEATRVQKSPLQAAEVAVADDIEADETLPVKPAEAEVSSDLQLVTLDKPKAVEKKPLPIKITPSPVYRPRIQKASKPPPAPVIIPATLKTHAADPEEAVKPDVPPPDMALQAKAILQTEQEQLDIENEKIRRQLEAEQRIAEENALADAKRVEIARAVELEKVKAEKARLEQLARLKAAEEKAAREKLAHERAAAEKAAAAKLEQARLAADARKSSTTLAAQPGGNALSTAPANVIAAATAQEKPLITVAPANGTPQPKNQPEQKGFALPPVNGDIKLIMTSEEDFIVKVLFVSHPKARHDRPLSKKEAKEQQKLTPIVVRTAKNTLEAVIEHSREGIYIFMVEQKGSKPVQGKFSLKLFETKNKAVSGREISGQTEIARLLMPEGILWEDDSAFSGNIEDSDSITKFNSDSGLVWKEYRR
jgi:hypothetical protein